VNRLDKSKINSDMFCYYPFYQLVLHANGNLSPCCYNYEIIYDNISDNSFKDIWNSETVRKLRREFLESNPKTCQKKMSQLGCHRTSVRDFTNSMIQQEIMEFPPKRLDVRLSGRCNLQCIMCSVWKETSGPYENSDFWNIGKTEIFPYIYEIDVLGGEPFVQSETFRLIDAVHEVNTSCQWAFVTNGQYRMNSFIKSYLDKIEIRWIQVSLDSLVSETYSKIRLKGELSKALSTVENLLQYQEKRKTQGRPFQLLASMCVQILNWSEIEQFLNFSLENGIVPIFQFSNLPDETSLLHLPLSERRKIFSYLFSLMEKYGPEVLQPVSIPLKESLISKR